MTQLIPPKKVHKVVHQQAEDILFDLGIPVRRIPRTVHVTPDFEADGVAYEVTTLHTYIPHAIETLRNSVGHLFGSDTHVLLYADESGKLKTQIVYQGSCQRNLATLRIRHDISCYREKIIAKIRRKYEQMGSYSRRVLVFDFRVAPFDSQTLGNTVSRILKAVGKQFPELVGILVCIPKFRVQPILGGSLSFFIRNPFSQADLPKELKEIEGIPDPEWIIAPFLIELFFKTKKGWNRFALPAPQFVPIR